MPKIPVSGNQVQRKGFGRTQVSTRAPVIGTSNNAAAAAQLSNTVLNIYEAEKQKNMKSETEEGEIALRDLYNRKLHGYVDDNNQQVPGFYSRKGKSTLEGYDEDQKEFEQDATDIVNSFGGEEVKKRLGILQQRYQADYGKNTNIHTAKEMDSHYNKQALVNIKSLQEDARLNYDKYGNDSSKVSESIKSIQSSIYGNFDANGKQLTPGYKDRTGMSAKEAKEFELDALSGLHAGVVSQMVNNGQDLLAKQYYAGAKKNKQIDGDTAAKLDKLLQASSTKGESQRQADEIMSLGLGMGASIEKAREIEDPEVRDATVTRVKSRINEQKLIKEETDKNRFDGFVTQIENFQSVDAMPVEQRAQLSSKQEKVMSSMLDMISKGYQPTTDPITEQDLMIEAGTNPQAFLRRDINLSAHKLSSADRKKFLGMQTRLRSNDQKTLEDLGDFMSHTQQIKVNLVEHGITSKPDQAKFSAAVQAEAVRWQRNHGEKKIPDDELQKIIDKMMTPVGIEGATFFNDPDKRLFELDQGDKIKTIEYDDIPNTDLNKMMKLYRSRGMNPSKAKITSDYINYLNQR